MIPPVPLPPPVVVREDGPECVDPECAPFSQFIGDRRRRDFRIFAMSEPEDESDVRLTSPPSILPVVRTLKGRIVSRQQATPSRVCDEDILSDPL